MVLRLGKGFMRTPSFFEDKYKKRKGVNKIFKK